MPDKIGGEHMAALITSPDAVKLLSIMNTKSNKQFRIAEIISEDEVSLEDLNLWIRSNCTILGTKDSQNRYNLNPVPTYKLARGERLIVMGSEDQIEKARKIMK
jgi:voltage-gated potassium channel